MLLAKYCFKKVIYDCLAINCTTPPERPPSGTWEWNKSYEYQTQILYTCGPYGKFKLSDGNLKDTIVSECAWNKTWVPTVLDPCQGYCILFCIFLRKPK